MEKDLYCFKPWPTKVCLSPLRALMKSRDFRLLLNFIATSRSESLTLVLHVILKGQDAYKPVLEQTKVLCHLPDEHGHSLNQSILESGFKSRKDFIWHLLRLPFIQMWHFGHHALL